MFDDASRYFKQETYTLVDHRGREVTVVVPPDALSDRCWPACPRSLTGK